MWFFETSVGTFFIVRVRGRYAVLFEDEGLGVYSTPNQAAEDLANGHTFLPSSGVDPAELGIPEEVGDWERTPS
jgi:hypothetical protein